MDAALRMAPRVVAGRAEPIPRMDGNGHDTGTAPGQARGRRVLMVEDEHLLAEDLREALGRQGAEVLGPPTAAGSQEATGPPPAGPATRIEHGARNP